MINNTVGELYKRQTLVEETVYNLHVPQIKELYEEIQLLKEKVAKLENERQIQSNTQEE